MRILTSEPMNVIPSQAELYWSRYGVLTPLKADASFRRYFRLTTASTHYIIADCGLEPSLLEQCRVQYHLFSQNALPIPIIDTWHTESHSYRVQDLGSMHLIGHTQYMPEAFLLLNQLQRVSLPPHLPNYTQNKLIEIPDLFETYYLSEQSTQCQNEYSRSASNCWSWLQEQHQEIPMTWCHGDFHAENIMIYDSKLYMIDYQDSLGGPITLDYISLIDDVRMPWDPILREQMMNTWSEHLANKYHTSPEVMHLWMEATSLFRLLRILAVFKRLSKLYDKHHYLVYIPQIQRMITHQIKDIPILAPLKHWVMP